jgi:metallo-beta-lactamase family protein
MFQGERMCSKHNFEDFNFDPQSISAVIITHAHVDHTGRIPLLIKQGFTGPIYCTAPTLALAKIVLEDTEHVMADNSKRCGDPILYTKDDIRVLVERTEVTNYHEQFSPAPGVTAMFHDAGHILGSSYVTIDVPESETADHQPRRLVFSGDIGNDDVPILPATEPLHRADIAIVESTYGDQDHGRTADRSKKLFDYVTKVINRGGTLIIPAFSVERTQELLYELDGLIEAGHLPKVKIYLDSPLAIKATQFYRDFKSYLDFDRRVLAGGDQDFFSFPNLHETASVEASKAINEDKHAKIIIAGAGMMTGGRVLHHLMRYLPDEKSGVLIIGYQAYGTLGSKIQQGAKEVRIFGEKVEVRAGVETIHEFSAHGDRAKLAGWLVPQESRINQVFLVHGDPPVKEAFKKYLEQKIDSEIIIPRLFQQFEF